MIRYSRSQSTARLAVEELEPRCLLNAHAVSLQPPMGPGHFSPVPAGSGGLPGLAMVAASSSMFQPDNFVAQINNPYLPLIPGTTFIYSGTVDGQPLRAVVSVTDQTKNILGVRTTVVVDTVYINGQLAETAIDWYAQDKQGNVWYFGEITKEYENGKVVSTEGTWRAGVHGAQPGIVMEAQPMVGDSYQQELAPGVAEDMATVLSLHAHLTVPYGTFNNCLKTQEFTPLEPGFVEEKFYAAGVGFLRSVAVQGGSEVFELIDILLPGD